MKTIENIKTAWLTNFETEGDTRKFHFSLPDSSKLIVSVREVCSFGEYLEPNDENFGVPKVCVHVNVSSPGLGLLAQQTLRTIEEFRKGFTCFKSWSDAWNGIKDAKKTQIFNQLDRVAL